MVSCPFPACVPCVATSNILSTVAFDIMYKRTSSSLESKLLAEWETFLLN